MCTGSELRARRGIASASTNSKGGDMITRQGNSGLPRVLAGFASIATFAVALGGCVGEGEPGYESGTESTEQALTSFNSGAWDNSMTPQILGPSALTTCFLTRVAGKFSGGGEYVQVAREFGNWVLKGGTQQASYISASALCIGDESTTPVPISWSKGQPSKFLQHDGSCFLTRVVGKFAGGGESVLISQDANRDWYLSGSTQTPETIGASATCVARAPISSSSDWAVSGWDWRIASDGHPATKACFLQGIKGAFQGSGEQVYTSHGSTTNYWHLSGFSNSSQGNYTIGATASCLGGADSMH